MLFQYFSCQFQGGARLIQENKGKSTLTPIFTREHDDKNKSNSLEFFPSLFERTKDDPRGNYACRLGRLDIVKLLLIAKKKKEKLYIILDNAYYHKSAALVQYINKK